MTSMTTSVPKPDSPWQWPPTLALGLLASILVGFLAASSAPTPLYALYREAWGFSALLLTLVFSSYAFALLAALLIFGRLSDHLGRRSVVLAALVLEIASTLLFWHADSIAWLFAARSLQGVATGIATGVLGAALIDLHRERGAMVNTVAPMLGMALGALGTSVLVQFAPEPTTLVFKLLVLLFAVQALAAYFLPETARKYPGAIRSLRPRVAIPAQARATLLHLLPMNTALWALGGFYLSLGPSLARVVTHQNAPVVGGALIAALVLPSAVAILFVRNRPAERVVVGSTVALVVGLGVTLTGVLMHSSNAFFCGTMIAGLGFGAGFNGALRSLVVLATPEERGGLMSGFFAISYLAFSLPAILAGLAVGIFGLHASAVGFNVSLIVLAATALGLMWRRA